MKKTITAILLLTMCAVGASAKIKHPSLLFTPARVEAARKAMRSDSVMAASWEHIKAEADRQLAKGDVRKLEYPALAYLMTADKAYAEKIREVLLKTAKTASWGDREMLARTPAWRSELQMAHRAFQVAVAYDAIYDFLSPAERNEIAAECTVWPSNPCSATGSTTTHAYTRSTPWATTGGHHASAWADCSLWP